jgi:hypothetical protein
MSHEGLTALASLRRLVKPRAVRERCELCSAPLAAEHRHLVELATRRLYCACDACAILFSNQQAGRYRRVPERIELLTDFRQSDVEWEALQLPINLAYFLHSIPAGRVVAFYPSPAGATEALPALDAWQALVDENPALQKLEPDVEALLINRLGPTPEAYRVGVDECYKLVGVIRMHWRGISGGREVWVEIARYFAELRKRAGVNEGATHA